MMGVVQSKSLDLGRCRMYVALCVSQGRFAKMQEAHSLLLL